MTVCEVIEATKAGQWKPDDGPALDKIHLTLTGPDGYDGAPEPFQAVMFQKQGKSLPSKGDTLDVEIGKMDNRDKRRKVKRVPKGGSGGGGMRQTHPVDARRMSRSHAQDMAMRFIQVKASIGRLPKDFDDRQNFTWDDVQQLTDKFDRDATHGREPPPQTDLPWDEGEPT